MLRKTKIIATIGPACDKKETLRHMLLAGVDVLRINFSHDSSKFPEVIAHARALAAELNHPLAIMADLQGPKIRIGRFKKGKTLLISGQFFSLDCHEHATLGDNTTVSVAYKNLYQELSPDDYLLLDDGLIELQVVGIQQEKILCRVIEGGVLSDHKGINRKGGGLNAGALTNKDREDLSLAVNAAVDYITLSFVKNADDINQAKQLLQQLGTPHIPIIAKIERTEALAHLTEIIQSADAVMVARGDLGVEIGAAEVPGIQKKIIESARQHNKIVITATQMMESMITHPQPTRAEVSDVANAILDGTDAVMLSAETASGQYPVKVIAMVHQICLSAEKHANFLYTNHNNTCHYQHADQAIAMASMHIANHFPLQAIIALTESGATAIWMSRLPSNVPIFALTDNPATVGKLSLVNNVFPMFFDYMSCSQQDLNQKIIDYLLKKKLIDDQQFVLLTRGSIMGIAGGTNCLEVLKVSV